MGETPTFKSASAARTSFSILKRIVMGETNPRKRVEAPAEPFSILKRIVMGETRIMDAFGGGLVQTFQYPQADRDG